MERQVDHDLLSGYCGIDGMTVIYVDIVKLTLVTALASAVIFVIVYKVHLF